ncbi:S1C family serine protease [Spirosoma rhododendri]|uniref:Trypsin-like peptidase domain-containing protein n=1 Tax=Spirosoma rhododendri TaxID=2728024 RepID=A0A7L5DWQ2_9BACT|nr:serine protease [Spirosoma rhododendri]QJD81078.1 trypsin-like peptidase domain-containing protein [Spirosoma rhododendri]
MNEEQELENALRAYGDRVRLRRKLATVHASIDMDEMRQQAETFREESTPFRSLWQTYRTTLAVAASVAVITTFTSIFIYRSYQNSHQQQQQQYSQLSKEIQAVKSSQRRILNDLDGRGQALNAAVASAQVAGTGFMLTPDGYLVTSNHTVRDADSVYVQSQQGSVYKARVVYNDQPHDLAILQLCDDSSFRPSTAVIPYGIDSHPSDLGERVFTLGYPRDEIVYGEGYLSSSTGYQGDSTAYQVAIGVNPGNSGGPLLNEKGNLIGIISGKQTTAEGVSFAVKTDYLLQTINSIPGDSLKGQPLRLNRKNALTTLTRKQQIKRMMACVYQVSVFKHR